MFDDLRNDAASKSFGEEEAKSQPAAVRDYDYGQSASSGRFLGMTSMQRFVLAFMLLLTVCVLGSLVLFVMGKFAL